MTVSQEQNQAQVQTQETKPSDKELNFRALEAKFQRQLEQERNARLEAEKKAAELERARASARQDDDEDDDAEPYVDHKRLNKKLAKFGEQSKQQVQSEIQRAVQMAIQEERKNNWIKQNSDFHDVLQHANKLAEQDPELAESILEMPEGFERQKLVYKSIKSLGLHKPQPKEFSIQDKVNANKKAPYYQPSGVNGSPYSNQSDFSPAGQKQAYEKMQELKRNLRLG